MEPIDKAMHNGLMKLLNEGTFELKAREVQPFMKVYQWANDLPLKLAKPVKKKKDEKQ